MKCEKHPQIMITGDGFGNAVCVLCQRDELATLRTRLEQAEKERDEAREELRITEKARSLLELECENCEEDVTEIRTKLHAAESRAAALEGVIGEVREIAEDVLMDPKLGQRHGSVVGLARKVRRVLLDADKGEPK